MKKGDESGKNERPSNDLEDSRRDFLKKAGKLAVYTTPAMTVLMRPSMATLVLSNGEPDICQFPGNDCPP